MSRRTGVSAVEFALVSTLTLLLCFALMDWSWMLFEWMSLKVGTERGVRIAAGLPTADNPTLSATQATQAWLAELGLEGAVVQTQLSGEVLTTQVDCTITPLVGLVPVPDRLRVRASAVWYGGVYDPRE